MRSRTGLKMYTLRHFFFYMAVSAFAGAVIGVASRSMNWSIGLVYGVGLSVGAAIVVFALREGLFGPSRIPQKQHRGHA